MNNDGFFLEPPQDIEILQITTWKRLRIDENTLSPIPLKILTEKKPDVNNTPEKIIYKNGDTKTIYSGIKRPTEHYPGKEVEIQPATDKKTGEKVELFLWTLFAEEEENASIT